ncbi:MAG: hypothetical protein ACYC9K_05360 [Sulfuricaulis sp.]
MATLSACGGGGANQQASTSTSTNNIVFSAASPDAPAPSSQTVTATVSAGTIYLSILQNATTIDNVSYTLSGTTATITITPTSPASLGAGIFQNTIAVTGYSCADPACNQLASGNTRTVNVSYRIPPIVRFVAPYVVSAGVPGTVIIRGQGFQQFSIAGVVFGNSSPSPAIVLSDTEIETSYPVLTAGPTGTGYPVQLQVSNSPGTIISEANLTAVSAPSYAPATIATLSGTPHVKKILYDAARQAVLVAVDTSGGEILRYPYSGSWGSATSATISSLSDIALSGDGSQLLALSQSTLSPLDPTTLLAAGAPTPAPAFATTGTVFNNLAMGNDGNAVVTTALPPNTSTGLYIYNACNASSIGNTSCTPAFPVPPSTAPALDNSTAVASEDGSLIAILQGDATQTSPPAVYQYAAASDTFSATSVALNQNTALAPAAPAISVYTPAGSTTSATYIVLSGTDVNNATVVNVYDGSYNLLGTLPTTTLAVAVYQSATQVRAYTLDSATSPSKILTFNLASPSGGTFTQVGSGVTPTSDPGTGVKMTISADGGNLFLAGSNAVVVAQTPP